MKRAVGCAVAGGRGGGGGGGGGSATIDALCYLFRPQLVSSGAAFKISHIHHTTTRDPHPHQNEPQQSIGVQSLSQPLSLSLPCFSWPLAVHVCRDQGGADAITASLTSLVGLLTVPQQHHTPHTDTLVYLVSAAETALLRVARKTDLYRYYHSDSSL